MAEIPAESKSLLRKPSRAKSDGCSLSWTWLRSRSQEGPRGGQGGGAGSAAGRPSSGHDATSPCLAAAHSCLLFCWVFGPRTDRSLFRVSFPCVVLLVMFLATKIISCFIVMDPSFMSWCRFGST